MTVIGHQEKMLWILLFTERAILAQDLKECAQLSRTLSLRCYECGGEILCHTRRGSQPETSHRLHICALTISSPEGDANSDKDCGLLSQAYQLISLALKLVNRIGCYYVVGNSPALFT